jgi:vacuolar protein sorting-associated protein IST1
MGELLSQSREASARIRVENIIHTDVTVELMEILELYAELLQARAGLLDIRDKNIKEGLPEDTGLEEAAASIIYAAPRLARDIKELAIVRNMLIERFGKEFATKANEGVDVPTRVTDKLKVDPPKSELVQAYLEEIARTYGIDWPKHKEEIEEMEAEIAEEPQTPNRIDLNGLSAPTDVGGAKSPVSVAPPGARTDNPSPKVKLPGGEGVNKKVQNNALGAPPTVDDLAKRFSALKR